MKDNTIDVFISDFPFETDFSDVCRETERRNRKMQKYRDAQLQTVRMETVTIRIKKHVEIRFE